MRLMSKNVFSFQFQNCLLVFHFYKTVHLLAVSHLLLQNELRVSGTKIPLTTTRTSAK